MGTVRTARDFGRRAPAAGQTDLEFASCRIASGGSIWTIAVEPLRGPADKMISQKKDIDFGARERFERIVGSCHQRLLVVERRVQNERDVSDPLKFTDQRMKQRVLLRVHQLHPASFVAMQHGRDTALLLRIRTG